MQDVLEKDVTRMAAYSHSQKQIINHVTQKDVATTNVSVLMFISFVCIGTTQKKLWEKKKEKLAIPH